MRTSVQSAALSAHIAKNSARLISTLQELVRIPTVNPPGRNYDDMSRLLADRLRGLGLRTRRFIVPKSDLAKLISPEQTGFPRYNVLGTWRTGAKRTIHFNAHYDVVPASDKWSDVFTGKLIDGRIYGRGTGDMKGSIACLLLALEAFKASGQKPAMNMEVSFTCDEETGGLAGAGWLARHGGLRADGVVVMEGASGDRICCGHNGVLWLEVAVEGKAAHGSQPHLGVNAFEKMTALAASLEDYKTTITARSFTTPDGTILHPTINTGGMFGGGKGGKINTVPARAIFSIDRRILPSESASDVEKELRNFITTSANGIPQCRLRVTRVLLHTPCFHEPDGPLFEAMQASVQTLRRKPVKFQTSRGFNDMGLFAKELGVPVAGYGVIDKNAHGDHESVALKHLIQCAQIYAHFLHTGCC